LLTNARAGLFMVWSTTTTGCTTRSSWTETVSRTMPATQCLWRRRRVQGAPVRRLEDRELHPKRVEYHAHLCAPFSRQQLENFVQRHPDLRNLPVKPKIAARQRTGSQGAASGRLDHAVDFARRRCPHTSPGFPLRSRPKPAIAGQRHPAHARHRRCQISRARHAMAMSKIQKSTLPAAMTGSATVLT